MEAALSISLFIYLDVPMLILAKYVAMNIYLAFNLYIFATKYIRCSCSWFCFSREFIYVNNSSHTLHDIARSSIKRFIEDRTIVNIHM